MKTFFEKHCWLRRAVVCVCAYLCVFALGKVIALHGSDIIYWGGKYFGYNLLSVVLFGVTVWLFNRFMLRKNKRLKVISVLGGVLLSVAVVWGAYAHYENDIFINGKESILQICMILSLAVLGAPLMSELILIINQGGKWLWMKDDKVVRELPVWITKASKYFKAHTKVYFLFVWATIFLCHLPIFLAYWPGNFVFDAKYQLGNVIVDSYSTHHPLIHTLMMGKAYQFGESIGNVSAGYQFYTLAQMLILSASFAYTLLYLYKKDAKSVVLMASWAFFALFPMNPIFAISATKDVLCAAFFLLFMVLLVRYIWDREDFKVTSYIGMVISGVLLALFRNNALYAVLVAAVFLVLFIKGWKEKGKLVLIFAIICILAKLVNAGLISYTNAWENDTYKETMCVPLQCLARVVDYRGDELNPVLYEEICHYVPEEHLHSYNPYNADAVKGEADESLLRNNTLNFFKLWVKVGLQFPDEYIESIVTNTMGYWYPLNQGYYVSADVSLYHTLIGLGEELTKESFCPWVNAIYEPLFYEGEYRETPLLGFFFRNAPYMWMIVVFMLFALYKKDRKLMLTGALPVVYILTCFCGPMAALRYIYCIIVCAPLLIYLLLASFKK